MFSSINSYRKIYKPHDRSLRLSHKDYTSSYDKLLTKQGLVDFHLKEQSCKLYNNKYTIASTQFSHS